MIPFFTCGGNFEARVFGYMNGESDSTSSLSRDNVPSSSSFRIEFSDLSWGRKELKSICGQLERSGDRSVYIWVTSVISCLLSNELGQMNAEPINN